MKATLILSGTDVPSKVEDLKVRIVALGLSVEAIVFQPDAVLPPQLEHERLQGESEADFSLRMAKIQRKRLDAARTDNEASASALDKATRVW